VGEPAPSDLGAYELLDELGRGGMGRVLRARHRATGALRAVKVIAGYVDAEALERLRREGEALARVGGDGVVPVHEAGVEKGRAFLVLGLMPGGSLRDRLRARTRLDWREASALVVTVARALARCHAVGLVHRDLKPDNVLFDDEGRPRLADFGCVRDLGAASLTGTGETLGTLAYMAPEQVDGARPTPKVDVYALGVLLHELIAGRVPFDGSPVQVMREKLAPTRPRARLAALAGAPAALDVLVDRALAVDPTARPDAAGLADDLDAIREGRGRASVRAAWPVALLGAVVSVVLTIAAVLVWSRPEADPALPPPAVVQAPPVEVSTRPPPSEPERRRTLREAARALESGSVSQAAAIVSGALAATTAPAQDELELVWKAVNVRLIEEASTPAEEARPLRRACDDALRAALIALDLGGPLDPMVFSLLPTLVRRLNHAAGVLDVLDDALLHLLTDVLRRWTEPDFAHAAADLCETADRTGSRVSPAAVQAALDATLEIADTIDLRFTRGKLLAHRVLREQRADLIEAALADLARVRQSQRLSHDAFGLSLCISARLEGLAGRPGVALQLLDPASEAVMFVGREKPELRQWLALERARARLGLGSGAEAADELERARAFFELGGADELDRARRAQFGARARDARSEAELRALARELPECF
jgi:hypothetical protein